MLPVTALAAPSPAAPNRVLICTNTDPAHVHTDKCYGQVLICTNTDPNHKHDASCFDESQMGTVGLVKFTVEYFVTVTQEKLDSDGNPVKNSEIVRIAPTHEAVLESGTEHRVTLPDLTGKGYALDFDNIYVTAGGVKQKVVLVADNGTYTIGGSSISQDTHYEINYIYADDMAPYLVNYYGYNARGEQETLLYSFKGKGRKDKEVSVDIGVNKMMKTLFDALDAAEVVAAGDSGAAMISALTDYVRKQYATADHDITPLPGIAGRIYRQPYPQPDQAGDGRAPQPGLRP